MSLILEALRKSEAERRRAQAPDLFTPAQVAVAPASRVPMLWLATGAVLLLLLVAWLALRGRETPPVVERTPAIATNPAASPAAIREPTSATSTRPRRALPQRALPPEDVPAQRPAPKSANPSPDAAVASQARVTEPAIAIVPTPAPVRVPEPVASPAAAPPAAPPVATGPLRITELDSGARSQLPPLKLTMHMWNADPSRRFVILDGRRLAEGDRIGAIAIAEIRRGDVLLDWNGRILQLPLH